MTTLTRVAPERTDTVPVLSALFSAREFLRGILVKDNLKFVSLQACKAHLMLTRSQVRALDCIVEDFGSMTSSVTMRVASNGAISWEPTSTVFHFNGKPVAGLSVQFPGAYGTDDPKDVLMLGAPWAVLRKGAPDTGHCVYVIVTASLDSREILLNKPEDPDMMLQVLPRSAVASLDLTRNKKMAYIGKTSVGVGVRLQQHLYSAGTGCMTKFYQVMRGLGGKYQAQLPVGVFVVEQHASEDLAYAAEEMLIEKEASGEDCVLLNTIGSRQAFADLKKIDSQGKDVSPEYAEERLANLKHAAVANWEDPEYARAVICNNQRNFDYLDVSSIRLLHRVGKPIKHIAAHLGFPADRVKRVIDGRTYKRII